MRYKANLICWMIVNRFLQGWNSRVTIMEEEGEGANAFTVFVDRANMNKCDYRREC